MPFSYDNHSAVYGQQFSLAVALRVYTLDLPFSNHSKSRKCSEGGFRKCLILAGIFLGFGLSGVFFFFFLVAVKHALRDYMRMFHKTSE